MREIPRLVALGLVKFLAFLIVALSLACAYPLPEAPTAPTVVPVAVAAAPSPARFEISAYPEIGGKSIAILLSVWDEFGKPTPALDASCSSSSGAVYPQRITGTGAALAHWQGYDPLIGTVVCQTDGFDRAASVRVDLSAWSIQLSEFREGLDEQLRWRTYAILRLDQRAAYPALTRVVDWGDGTLESLQGHIANGSASQTISHVYARAGEYNVRAHVEWERGGVTESRVILARECRRDAPGVTIPAPAFNLGFCVNTFREVR